MKTPKAPRKPRLPPKIKLPRLRFPKEKPPAPPPPPVETGQLDLFPPNLMESDGRAEGNQPPGDAPIWIFRSRRTR